MAKVRVRYIGSNESALLSEKPGIPSIQFNRYGQLIEMDEDLFNQIIRGDLGSKLAIMMDSDFQQLGHTDDELVKFGNPASHPNATSSFTAKVELANQKLLDIHAAAIPVDNSAPPEEA